MSFGGGQTQQQGMIPQMPSQPVPPPMFGADNVAKKKPASGNTQQRQMAGTLLGAQQGGNPTNLGTKTLLGQ